MKSAQKILIFGGSFDPVHNGHLHIVKTAREQLDGLSQVVFVPAFISPGKSPSSRSPETRLRLLKLALSGTDFQVSPLELERGGQSYTVDTLREFREEFPSAELLLLMGGDSYENFFQWKEPEAIRSLATLVVAARQGSPKEPQDKRDRLLKLPLSPWSSTQLREALSQGKIPPNAFPRALEQELQNLILNGKNPYANL